jgi:phage recombination protein Bet
MTALAVVNTQLPSLSMTEAELVKVLQSSLYPGASPDSIKLSLGYCKAAGYDPMQKPVHIVPMWDAKQGVMRDVIMPGVGLYRTQAARTGQFAGMSEPEFGEDVTEKIGGVEITYPKWCRFTVKRLLNNGGVAEFTVREFWKENYAVKGGKEKSIAPNAMWAKRPYAQLAKCAEAQALRKGFPDATGAAKTADEMEGREIRHEVDITPAKPQIEGVKAKSEDRPSSQWVENSAAPTPPAGAAEPAAAPAASTSNAPMTAGQKRIIKAKMANAGLNDVAVQAKFDLSLDDEAAAWTVDHFATLQDWIKEKQGA